jgi:hypothetical protein
MLTGWAVDTFKRIQNAIGNTCRTVEGLVLETSVIVIDRLDTGKGQAVTV